MATPVDPLYRIEGIKAINGPASVNAVLLDSVTTANYEGIWVPWQFVKQGSMEISGSMSTLSCQLYGTNSYAPLNSYTVTIGGTITVGLIDTLTFAVPGNAIAVTYTAVGSDSTTVVAAGLTTAINANTALAALGITATSVGAVITVVWPSIPPSAGLSFYSNDSPPTGTFLTITGASTGSNTYTIAAASSGSALSAAVTTLGYTQFTFSTRWLKLRLTALTGGGAVITAIAQGTA